MALPAAIALGGAAALGLPYLVRNSPDAMGGVLRGKLMHVPFVDLSIHWSWPVFCIVTLIAWGSLKASRNDW